MADLIPSQCAQIAGEVKQLELERAELQQALSEASPLLKPYYVREIRKLGLELAPKRQELRECLQNNPSPPRPNLLAKAVILKVSHATRRLGVSALIRNIGRGNARGPFRIDLGITMKRGTSIISSGFVFEVPASVTIAGEQVFHPAQALSAIPGSTTLSQEYATEEVEYPLYYRDENPSCIYEFEFIVDSEQMVSETNEQNNRYFVRWWTTTPTGVRGGIPFVIEPSAVAMP